MGNQVTSEAFGEVIYAYTREDAIEDGTFMDVTKMAQEAGFRVSVAITEGIHSLCEPTAEAKSLGQSFDGRLWDVLFMASVALKGVKKTKRITPFKVIIREKEKLTRMIDMWISFEGDADGKPAATILLPSEY